MSKLTELYTKYPTLLRRNLSKWTFDMYGFEVDGGWADILDELLEFIKTTLMKNNVDLSNFKVEQIKEKFSGLRFYYSLEAPKEVVKLISDKTSEIEDKSFSTCEICGEKGKLQNNGWIVTRCDKCNKENS